MSFKPFKPMLASEADLDKLVYPVLGSPKFDGIRSCTVGNQALSRNGKPIPNNRVRALLEKHAINLDGELIVGNPTAANCFNLTTSAVMSRDCDCQFRLFAFDVIGQPQTPFWRRLEMVRERELPNWIVPVDHVVLNSREDLDEYEARHVAEGWEGVMLRSPDGWYKYGRSTVREGGLLKLKRFQDDEAIVTGVEELYRNENEAMKDTWGHTVRGDSKAGMVPAGVLGALVVDYNGVELRLGSGFTAAQRAELWAQRDNLPGRKATFKFQRVGSMDAPRFPTFKGFRLDK